MIGPIDAKKIWKVIKKRPPKFVAWPPKMTIREERLARIKQQIAKAVSEIEHGDQAAALLALVDAFKIREEIYEADYERQQMPLPIVVGPDEGDHPRGALPVRIKVTKR